MSNKAIHKIHVLLVEPEKKPQMVYITNELPAIQCFVQGSIETVTIDIFNTLLVIVCNQEGKLLDLKNNRMIVDKNGEVIDVIKGTFFVCGIDNENFASVPSQYTSYLKELFSTDKVCLNL